VAALRAIAAPVHDVFIEDSKHYGELPVGLAWDEAFSFAYADTLDRMERLGVRWVKFSPLRDRLPEGIAGLYLPGGYPELHAEELSRNNVFRIQLKRALEEGMPCYAECGGLMVLTEALVTLDGRSHEMVGAIPGRVRMTDKLQRFGYKELETASDTILAPAGSKARGHEFHCSVWEDSPMQNAYITHFPGNKSQNEGYAQENLLATYCHIHFASAPAWAESWVARMKMWKMQS
jgi:cobyrinic acid a,c-diamide synthase